MLRAASDLAASDLAASDLAASDLPEAPARCPGCQPAHGGAGATIERSPPGATARQLMAAATDALLD